jgi:uncharacterized protein YdhG (YjbR/CyaY superfamily)
MKKTLRPENVDDYIKAAPKEARSKLREIRKIIRSVAPRAEEKISYGMPHYSYKGRLAYFAAFKDHVSLFAMPRVVGEHESEVKKYRTGKSTLRFPFDQKLPASLIKELIKSAVRKNEVGKD